MKIGIVRISRCLSLFCGILRKSAAINLAVLSAVSPVDIGAAMTPSIAKRPPIEPNQSFVMWFTIIAALFSSNPFSLKKQVAAAA